MWFPISLSLALSSLLFSIVASGGIVDGPDPAATKRPAWVKERVETVTTPPAETTDLSVIVDDGDPL